MKALLKVCGLCGYVQFFAVEILCRPGAPDEIGTICPACHRPQSAAAVATEIDQTEIGEPVDEEEIARSIARYVA